MQVKQMIKNLLLFALLTSVLTGCTTTETVPVFYMPAPPAELMESPQELETIVKAND